MEPGDGDSGDKDGAAGHPNFENRREVKSEVQNNAADYQSRPSIVSKSNELPKETLAASVKN